MAKQRSKLKVGDRVKWTIGRGKNQRVFEGKIFVKNPRIAPGVKYGIRVKGESYYPICKLKKVESTRRR